MLIGFDSPPKTGDVIWMAPAPAGIIGEGDVPIRGIPCMVTRGGAPAYVIWQDSKDKDSVKESVSSVKGLEFYPTQAQAVAAAAHAARKALLGRKRLLDQHHPLGDHDPSSDSPWKAEPHWIED